MWLTTLAIAWLVAAVSVGSLLFAEGRRVKRERADAVAALDAPDALDAGSEESA